MGALSLPGAEGPAFITSLTRFTFLYPVSDLLDVSQVLPFSLTKSVKEYHFLISRSPNIRDSVPLLRHVSRLPLNALCWSLRVDCGYQSSHAQCAPPETPISDLQEESLTFILMASLKQHRKSERKSFKPAESTETKIDKPDQLMLQSVVGFHFPD